MFCLSGLFGHLEIGGGYLPVHVGWNAHWPHRMLQSLPRLLVDRPMHHQHLLGVHDRVLALVLAGLVSIFATILAFADCLHRVVRARHSQSDQTSRQALRLSVPRIRGVCHPNLVAFHCEQLDFRWRALHRYGSWFRGYQDLVQHPLLSLRRAKYLSRHADARHALLRDADVVDWMGDILLGVNSLPLHRPLPLQPPSVLVHRLHHRLPRVPQVDEQRQLAIPFQLLDRLLSPVAYNDYWLQEEAFGSSLRETFRGCPACRLACRHLL